MWQTWLCHQASCHERWGRHRREENGGKEGEGAHLREENEGEEGAARQELVRAPLLAVAGTASVFSFLGFRVGLTKGSFKPSLLCQRCR